jgi:hypothetical protein
VYIIATRAVALGGSRRLGSTRAPTNIGVARDRAAVRSPRATTRVRDRTPSGGTNASNRSLASAKIDLWFPRSHRTKKPERADAGLEDPF